MLEHLLALDLLIKLLQQELTILLELEQPELLDILLAMEEPILLALK